MISHSITNPFRNLQIFHSLKHTQVAQKLGLPARPKKPIAPYFQYMIGIRPSVVAQHPKLATTDHIKIISKMWNSLNASDKETYYKLFASEQVVYNELIAKYNETVSEDDKRLLKTKLNDIKCEIENRKYVRSQRKKAIALDRPKKPMSMFFKYLKDQADRQSNEKHVDYRRRKSSDWKSLSTSEREAFREPAHIMQKYKNDCLEWKGKIIKLGKYDVLKSEIPNYVNFDNILNAKKKNRFEVNPHLPN